MKEYNFQEIEQKWQKIWEDGRAFCAKDFDKRKKFYGLIEFPYPSGEGLHVGHPRSYTAMDVVCRKKRMQGENVLLPIGFDAFGLPAENYAMKTGTHPRITTEKNIANYTRQLKSLGYSFDWERAVNTTDPKYYKWTQWIFLKLFEHSLAYKTEAPTNWCTSCQVTLANEEVVNGTCERCGNEVVKKLKKQWMLRITAYAQKLLDGLDKVDYLDVIKEQQRNWIGKSTGANIDFALKDFSEKITVFTTRPDTLFGVTYVVLSPEHKLVSLLTTPSQSAEVEKYQEVSSKKTDIERSSLEKEKTGVFTGAYAVNPVNGHEVPVWIADYVLSSYGTGAVMAVPAHDFRDYEFAKKYELEIIKVVEKDGDIVLDVHEDDGITINSDFLNGLATQEAKEKIIEWLETHNHGKRAVTFKLRDWVFSRQRYWGEPIPIIECEKCGYVPMAYEDLPLELPDLPVYTPSATGESPLANLTEWVNVKCPKCEGLAKRETDTMPQWAGSSWYFLRYTDSKNDSELAGTEQLKYWMPVDLYSGGPEHITLHLLYSRFWNNFLYDIGVVPVAEPYQKRVLHGLVLGGGGVKMSKSKGNVVNPDDIVREFGADTFRMYILFMGPFDQAIPWDQKGVVGVKRFLEKVWRLSEKISETTVDSPQILRELHKAIKKVGDDIESMRFNTAISTLMSLINELSKQETLSKQTMYLLLQILCPFAPHITEELAQKMAFSELISQSPWPHFDETLAKDTEREVAVQINGKIRDQILVPSDISEEEIKELVLQRDAVKKWVEGKEMKKFIYVQGRLVSIVV